MHAKMKPAASFKANVSIHSHMNTSILHSNAKLLKNHCAVLGMGSSLTFLLPGNHSLLLRNYITTRNQMCSNCMSIENTQKNKNWAVKG